MPEYRYECEREECEYFFDTYQSIFADNLTECPECHQHSLRRVIYPPIVRDKSSPKTLGALAEQNFKKLPQHKKDEMFEKDIKAREKRTHQRKILKNPEKYIRTGEY